MGLANGVHHLAICTADIKKQIEFFTDVLGCELAALYWMHGVDGTFHGFLRFGDSCSIAFVQNDQVKQIEPALGVSHAKNTRSPSAPGTMQHVAFNVDDEDALLALRDRVRSRGVNIIGPIDHGFCKSIYFAGPEGLNLEISTSAEPIDERAWIDPQVVELAGINAEELERYKNPAAYRNETGKPVPQPPIDPEKPHFVFPKAEYEKMMTMPDEELTALRSQPEPPVKVAG